MSEFDCGNRTGGCDNATICPCLNFINKETRSYSELLNSSLFREATKEERESVDNYIKSISKKLHTFTDEQLDEHDKQIRADVIDEFYNKLLVNKKDINLANNPWNYIELVAREMTEQLKEKK